MCSPGILAFFLRPIKAAKGHPDSSQPFCLAQTRLHVLTELLLLMKAQLVLELCFGNTTPQEAAEAKEKIVQHGEDPRSFRALGPWRRSASSSLLSPVPVAGGHSYLAHSI